jgi:hypothetical protein
MERYQKMEKIGEGMLYHMTQTSSLDFLTPEFPFAFFSFFRFQLRHLWRCLQSQGQSHRGNHCTQKDPSRGRR